MKVLKEAYNLMQTVRNLRERDSNAVASGKERKSNRKSYRELMQTLTEDEFKSIVVRNAEYLYAYEFDVPNLNKPVRKLVYKGITDDDKAWFDIKGVHIKMKWEVFKNNIVQGQIDYNKLTQIVNGDKERFEKLNNNVIVSNILEGEE